MKIRYYLAPSTKDVRERKDGELVYADVSNKFTAKIDGVVKYSKFSFSLEVYVKPHHFGVLKEKRGKVNFVYNAEVVDKNKVYTSDLRQAILNFENCVNQVSFYFRNKGVKPTKNQFKDKLRELTGKSDEVSNDRTVAKYIKERITYFRSIINRGNADKISENSIANYSSLLKVVENYDEVVGQSKKLTFANLKENYWKLWDVQDSIIRGELSVTRKEGEKKKPLNEHGIATNTLIVYQSIMRQVCASALSDDIEVSLSILDRNLILRSQKSSRQYSINSNDLLTIYNHTPSTERLQKAKDYVVFSSLTGMRLQSVLQVVGTPVQQYSNKSRVFDYVHTIQQKTKTECYTPLFKAAKDVIVRNGGKLPDFSKYSGTINKQIKDLFKEAGITYKIPVTKHYYKDGNVTTYECVDKVVSSHATRKAFVSNLYEFGVNTTTSKLVTHPDRNEAGSTDIYNKITSDIRAVRFYDEVSTMLEDNPLYRF